MNYFKHIILLCSLSSTFLYSQTIIEGSIPFMKNQSLLLKSYNEYLLNSTSVIEKVQVDSKGNFIIKSSKIKNTSLVELSCLNYAGSFYVSPNNEYTIECIKTDTIKKPVYSLQRMLIRVTQEKDSVNYWVDKINLYYDSVMYVGMLNTTGTMQSFTDMNSTQMDLTQKVKIHKPIRFYKADSVLLDFNKKFILPYHAFIKKYAQFMHSDVDVMLSNQYKRLFTQHIANKNKEYTHDAYMLLITDFYSDFLRKTTGRIEQEIIDALKIHKSDSLAKLAIEKTGFSDDNELSELILLIIINQYYKDARFDQSYFNYLLENRSKAALNPSLQELASAIIESKKYLNNYIPAPEVTISDENNKPIELKNISEKAKYLFFWTTWNSESLKELSILNQLYVQYKDYVDVIPISVDDDFKTFQDFIKAGLFPYTFNPYYFNDFEVLRAFNIEGIPSSFLISREYIIEESNKRLPSEGIEKYFFDIKTKVDQEVLDKKKKGKKSKVGER